MPRQKKSNTETALIKPDQLKQDLAKAGFDYDAELQEQAKGLNIEPPRVKIEHSDSGRHRMYIDFGESYFHEDKQFEDIKDNKLKAIVALAQPVRAWFVEGEKYPHCAAIEDLPTVPEPVCSKCTVCKEAIPREGSCKPKMRLFLLRRKNGAYQALVFPLSPTSIKRWKNHIKALQRDKIPYIGVVTTFELEDTKKDNYRWAEVKLGIDGTTTEEELQSIMEFRVQYKELFGRIDKRDFEDPGDEQKLDPEKEIPDDDGEDQEDLPF